MSKPFKKPYYPPKTKGNGEFHHKHALGQNFLTDEALLNSLIDASGVGPEDHILEVGPGGGDMTRLLAKRCKSVTAVEIDRDLIPLLRVGFEPYPNITLVEGSILKVNLPELMREKGPFHVVANIPYYLTTELLEMLLASNLPLLSINVMIQKEAADKLVAPPSTPAYCPLGIRAQYKAEPRIACIVPAACFTPPPKVDSAFVCLPMREPPAVQVQDEALFFKLVRTAFALRRKTLCNNLIASLHMEREEAAALLERAGIDEGARGEALSLAQFAALTNAFKAPEEA